MAHSNKDHCSQVLLENQTISSLSLQGNQFNQMKILCTENLRSLKLQARLQPLFLPSIFYYRDRVWQIYQDPFQERTHQWQSTWCSVMWILSSKWEGRCLLINGTHRWGIQKKKLLQLVRGVNPLSSCHLFAKKSPSLQTRSVFCLVWQTTFPLRVKKHLNKRRFSWGGLRIKNLCPSIQSVTSICSRCTW